MWDDNCNGKKQLTEVEVVEVDFADVEVPPPAAAVPETAALNDM